MIRKRPLSVMFFPENSATFNAIVGHGVDIPNDYMLRALQKILLHEWTSLRTNGFVSVKGIKYLVEVKIDQQIEKGGLSDYVALDVESNTDDILVSTVFVHGWKYQQS